MRHRFAYSWLLLTLFVVTEGCRSPGSPLAANPFGAEETTADSTKPNHRFLAAFRKSRKRAAAAEPRDSEPGSADASAQYATSGGTESGFDAETQALIDRKLASATPEQQARMRHDLQGVPPHLVPQVLNAFYLGRQLDEQTARDTSDTRYGHNDPRSHIDSSSVVAGNPQFANIGPDGQFSPQQPAGRSGQVPRGAGQPPQGFPGGTNSVAQAGYADVRNGDGGQIQQADWKYGQNPAGAQSVTRIGDYQPAGQSADVAQAGHLAPQRSAHPADNLPIYQQQEQQPPGRMYVGSLKPGEYDGEQNPRLNNPTAQPGLIQQANVTMANNAPVSLPSSTDQTRAAMVWRSQLGQTIGLAEQEVAQLRPGMNDDSPASRDFVENNVYLRMLYLMSDQPAQQARAWEPIPGIDPAQQEFWQYTLYGMSNYFDRNPQLVGPERYSEAVKSFSRATNKLRSLANLEIGDIALCSSVTNFGNYKRIEPEEFSPGQQVVLYAEIRNFTTRLTDENNYQTMLAPTIEFLIPGTGPMSGRAVHNAIEMQPTEDLCKYPRRDFFIASLFSIPRDLAQGRYVLKLTVTDKLGQKFAESTLNFKVK